MLLSDAWLEEFQQCIIRKHNGHTLRWRYDYSHTPRHLVTASLCFRGLCFFFWDALYTRNRDSERSMINATTRERRFERRLQRRFDYGYWNVFLLLGKVINAPCDPVFVIRHSPFTMVCRLFFLQYFVSLKFDLTFLFYVHCSVDMGQDSIVPISHFFHLMRY